MPNHPRRTTPASWRRHLLASAALLAAVPALATGDARAKAEFGRNYDLRIALAPATAPALAPTQSRALAALRAELPDLRAESDPVTGGLRTLGNATGYLTGARAGLDAESVALDFVREKLDLLGLTAADLDGYEVTDSVPSAQSGVTHLYLRQRLGELAVYNGQLQVNVGADGRILSVHNQFVPRLAGAVNATTPALDADDAVAAVARHLGLAGIAPVVDAPAVGAQQTTRLSAPELSTRPIEARLMLLPIRPGEVRLVWNLQVDLPGGEHWYDVTVDATDGRVWTRFDWVAAAQYKVYARPIEAPSFAAPAPPADARTTTNNPQDATASPFGWHDTNGVAGAESTLTIGNNVTACTDTDANNACDAGSSPDGGGSLVFTPALDLTQAPSAYRPAAVVNLFYWNNVIHDVAFLYGFDSPGGNFQVNTYGQGGAGSDPVNADGQDGSGINNANFGTPPDGSSPRMQMFLWNTATPNRDGDLDAGVIAHEYGHGISNRLVGGPSNVGCLGNNQQPGEGLSDWWSMFYTFDAASPQRIRGIGTYVLNQPTSGAGIRTQKYDGNPEPNGNTWTYASVAGSAIPHGVGEKWAQAYWEVTWALIDAHGFDNDVYAYTGTAADAGNIRAMYYIVEGLKNTICSPAFTDVRDGIVAAATSSYGGADVCRIWSAFAAYGLGVDAVSGGPDSTTPTNGFAIPNACSYLAVPPAQRACVGTPLSVPVGVGMAYTPPVNMSATGNPAPSTVSFSPNPVVAAPPTTTTLTIGNTAGVGAGTYSITVTGNDGVHNQSDSFDVTFDAGLPATTTLVAPTNSTSGLPLRPTFQWSAAAGAVDYLLEVDDDSNFSSPVYSATVAGTSHVPSSDLPGATLLYWRVRAGNGCGRGASPVYHFATGAPGEACSAGGVTINDNGPATPYSWGATVSGVSGTVPTVTVTLHGFTHTFPDDVDMLLVGPGGQKMVVFSDVGGGSDASALDLTLDDSAATLLPDAGPLASGSYRPSNVGATDTFPAPAPAGPYAQPAPAGADTLSSVFGGLSPNGTWNLYIVDDAGADVGSATSWCLGYANPDSMPFIDGFEPGNTSRWSSAQP